MKNLKTGNTQERNFNASTKFEQANISKKAAQFSYEADSTYYLSLIHISVQNMFKLCD